MKELEKQEKKKKEITRSKPKIWFGYFKDDE
jgi:hypothetical protein